jgi:hypothetical protein
VKESSYYQDYRLTKRESHTVCGKSDWRIIRPSIEWKVLKAQFRERQKDG